LEQRGDVFLWKEPVRGEYRLFEKGALPGSVRVDHFVQPGAGALENATKRKRVSLPVRVREAETGLRGTYFPNHQIPPP
jgi:hypothetical protein